MLALTACVKEPAAPPKPVTDDRPLLTILGNNYSFSMFYSSLQRTGLDKMLDSAGPFTLLAPDDDAFNRSGITPDSLARIETTTLRTLIGYHIIRSAVPYEAIPQAVGTKYPTVAGPVVYVSRPIPGNQQFQPLTLKIVHVNGVNVNRADITASNGIIHVMNSVLYYPVSTVKSWLENNASYSFFTMGLRQFGLFDQLDGKGPWTILAPSNDIFLQHGIDSAAISVMDTLTYKKFLFSSGVLEQQMFFATDIKDAPPSRDQPAFLMPDILLLFDAYNFKYGAVPYNYLDIENIPVGPYFGDPFIYGDETIKLSDPDHLAGNGVVHGVNGVAVLPENAIKQQ